ncbi:ArnT family glycosyltransferase [Cyanobium sp. ATX 6F1]|uniref:ArnT family glycosyltransferase n=1 Tax=Cyanobium sp. ATX 6F1 TaxID=2823702 RepID=UPI0020CE29EF|nr:glycosyltransferase family 39 protein [Cyanobium sp. ATX 6F1]
MVLGLTVALGVLLFLRGLGESGLVDETPPLFAAAARAMAETGDWLTPAVNGLPRYDKPPLVYWAMALGYLLPGQPHWNPLGTWAANLPTALASIAVMVALAFTLLRWPQPAGSSGRPPRWPALTALAAPLAFALSPLVILWGRIGVSDGLFTAGVALTLLLFWQAHADPRRPRWAPWPLLGLAVLAKGPVALLLVGLTLLVFGLHQGNLGVLVGRFRPLRGLAITALVAVPWFAAELVVEGKPFWDSFFGYHNLQRFSSVVNQHLQPWWYFGPVLVVASLPFTPLLLLGLGRALGRPRGAGRQANSLPATSPPATSLGAFAACWLLVVLAFFTVSATKLPSYWLPATPAAALLVALAAQGADQPAPPWPSRPVPDRPLAWAQGLTLLLGALLAAALWASPRWVPLINDPEMPTLPAELLASGLVLRAAFCFSLLVVVGLVLWRWPLRPPGWLLAVQLPLVLFQAVAVLPMWSLGDGVRQRPVRQIASELVRQRRPSESVAMVGILKPSLHYYSRRVVLYEGRLPADLVNLNDRLLNERRHGQAPARLDEAPTVLVVIDDTTSQEPYWQGLGAEELAHIGLYKLWRLDRRRLDERARGLINRGQARIQWRDPRPERY